MPDFDLQIKLPDLRAGNGDRAEWIDSLGRWVCSTDRYRIEIHPAGDEYDFPRTDGKIRTTIHDDPEKDLRFFERVRHEFLSQAKLVERDFFSCLRSID
jgi:hypothetical protein